MKKELLIFYLIFLLYNISVFSNEIEYNNFNIISTGDEVITHNKLIFSSDYLDLGYLNENYKLQEFSTSPEKHNLKIKTKYYDFLIDETKINLNGFHINDEILAFEENKNIYLEHTLKLSYKEFEFQYILGKNIDETYDFTSDIIDLSFSEFSLKNNGYRLKNNDYLFGYNNNNFESIFLLNHVSDIGKIEGKNAEYFIKYKNNKISYKKMDFYFNFDIDQYSAALISALSDKYIYGRLNINVEIYDLENKLTFELKKSKLTIKNNLGIIYDKGSYISHLEEYYKEYKNFGLWRIRSLSKETERRYEFKKSYIYYDTVNLDYERYLGNFTIGLNNFISIIDNPGFKNIKSEKDYEENIDKHQISSTKKMNNLIIGGLTVYFKYEF